METPIIYVVHGEPVNAHGEPVKAPTQPAAEQPTEQPEAATAPDVETERPAKRRITNDK